MNLQDLPESTPLIVKAAFTIDIQSLADQIAERLKERAIPSPLPEPPDNIELPEASAVIDKSKSWIYQNRDKIPHSRYGRKLIFSRRELLRWMAENTKRHVSLSDQAADQLQKEAKKKRI